MRLGAPGTPALLITEWPSGVRVEKCPTPVNLSYEVAVCRPVRHTAVAGAANASSAIQRELRAVQLGARNSHQPADSWTVCQSYAHEMCQNTAVLADRYAPPFSTLLVQRSLHRSGDFDMVSSRRRKFRDCID